jgi:hypothetical protein
VVVSEIEAALRTAAAQSVKQLQPGGSHYWRGKNAWRLQNQGQHNSSHSSVTSSAAAAAAKAATPDAAVAAAIAAAESAGRHCSAADLHAAWLMQRLDAGQLDVTVASPLVDMSALEQALANHGADIIPGMCCSLSLILFYLLMLACGTSLEERRYRAKHQQLLVCCHC